MQRNMLLLLQCRPDCIKAHEYTEFRTKMGYAMLVWVFSESEGYNNTAPSFASGIFEK